MPFAAMKSITLRLRIAFLVVAATTFCAGLTAIWVFRSVDQTYSTISGQSYPATRAISNLEKNALEVALALHLLSGATNEEARQAAYARLNQLFEQAPDSLSRLQAVDADASQKLAQQYAVIKKQSAETNQIVADLMLIDQENRQNVLKVEAMRSEFEQRINPLLLNAKQDLLLQAGKTSDAATLQWAQLTDIERYSRYNSTEVRIELFRLTTLILQEGSQGFRLKGAEIIDQLEQAVLQGSGESREEGLKLVKALRAPMRDVGREVAAAMLAFYRDTTQLNRKQIDEMNRAGKVLTQETASAVVKLVNTQVQTLTASEQLKSNYLQLVSILRKLVWANTTAALKNDSAAFAAVYRNALAATVQINNPLFTEAQQKSQAALLDIERQHQQIVERTQRRIRLAQLLEQIADDNQAVTTNLLNTTHHLGASISGDLSGQVQTLDGDIKQSTNMLMIATLVAMLIALLVGWLYVSRHLGNRLERLAGAMRSLSEGALGDEVIVHGRDEISDIEKGVAQFRSLLVQQREQTDALCLARDEAQAAAKMKSEFLANMSHEIRTPLTAILGYTNLIAANELSALQRQHIARVQTSAQMLLGVVNDVLDFSKMEANKLELEQSPFDLMQLLSQLAGTVAIQAQQKGLRLSFEIAPDVPTWLEGDALRLGQVLLNLLNNAIKFTEHGDVSLSLNTVQQTAQTISLRFAVLDSGIGISPAAQQRLFNLFSQADSSTTRRFGGSGLGLAISQQLIQLMGGEIGVRSEEGAGSEFSFELTLTKHLQIPAPICCLEPRRAVIADSNPDHAAHLALHLQALGCDCVVLNNQAQLLQYLQSGHQVDVLLAEVKLTIAADGAVCDPIAQVQQAGLPLILLCYGLDDVACTQQSVLSGCPLLIKPLVPSHIRALIAQVFDLCDPVETARANALADRHALQGLNVLLVEDTEILLDLGVTILSNMGAQVTAVSSGNAAIAAVMMQSFDVILMDVQMPDLDGRDTTRAIRALPGCEQLPILALTAHAMESERLLCLQAGMTEHLSKPIDALQLKQTLQRYLPQANGTVPDIKHPQPPSSLAEPVVPCAGVDFLTALQRMGSMSMLKKMLPRFLERFGQTVPQLESLLAQGQLADAERLAHTLKGVAGQIEAAEVVHWAAQIELQLHQGNTDLAAQLQALQQSLALACAQIEQWLANDESAVVLSN